MTAVAGGTRSRHTAPGGSPRQAIVLPDPALLAEAVAARLLLRLIDGQSHSASVNIALTGGTVGIKSLAAVAASPLVDAVDWTTVQLWWGDERFLPAGDPERNEQQARDALLTALGDRLPAGNVHPMPGPSDGCADPAESAARYAATLAAHGATTLGEPFFDVVLLGMGPDAHVGSVFPGSDTTTHAGRWTAGVTDSPKPPTHRTTLTIEALCSTSALWVIAAGAEKSEAVRASWGGETGGAVPVTVAPAGTVHGRNETLWLLDVTAAAGLPAAR